MKSEMKKEERNLHRDGLFMFMTKKMEGGFCRGEFPAAILMTGKQHRLILLRSYPGSSVIALAKPPRI